MTMSEQINSKNKNESEEKSENFKDFIISGFFTFLNELKIAKSKLENLTKTNLDLGLYHLNMGNLNDAAFRFKFVILMDKKHGLAYYYLGVTQLYQGNKKDALNNFKMAEKLKAKTPDLQFMMSKVDSKIVADHIPAYYVAESFNRKAANFNDQMLAKRYESYKLMVEKAALEFTTRKTPIDVLELGCGTGLAGSYLKAQFEITINHLAALDISHEMIFEAKQLIDINENPIYNEIFEVKIEDFVNDREFNQGRKFDLIISSLSLSYITELEQVLKDCHNLLKPHGTMAITLSKSNDKDIDMNIDREYYAYSEKYIDKIAKNAKFKKIEIQETDLMANERGFVCILKN